MGKKKAAAAAAAAAEDKGGKAERKRRQHRSAKEEADDYSSFDKQLEKNGLRIRDMRGDGNCLFRAFSDQLDGDQNSHGALRATAVAFMTKHRDDFAPFVEDDVPFDRHVRELAKNGVYAGNDAIVALARAKNLAIIVHQLNSPSFIISGHDLGPEHCQQWVHLAYHDYEHYSSVRKLDGSNFAGSAAKAPKVLVNAPQVEQKQPKKTAAAAAAAPKKYAPPPEQHVKTAPAASAFSAAAPGAAGDLGGNEEVESDIQICMAQTGITDRSAVLSALEDNHFDCDSAVTALFELLSLGVLSVAETPAAAPLPITALPPSADSAEALSPPAPPPQTPPTRGDAAAHAVRGSTRDRKMAKKLEKKANRLAAQRDGAGTQYEDDDERTTGSANVPVNVIAV